MPSSAHALLERLRAAIGLVYREMIKFGVVGAIAFVIDIGGANLLWHTVLESKVTTAKIISGAAATLFALGFLGAALLAGSACTRFGVFEAGQESARDPKYTVVPQRERVDRGEPVRYQNGTPRRSGE